MDLKTALTLLVTVCLALSGYFYSLFLARRKDKLDRINRQLSDLYGPLYALSKTGGHVWEEFRKVYRPDGGSYWKGNQPVSEEDAQAFRLWIRSVFMPLNRKVMDLVVNRADLLEGTKIPEHLLELCAHISSYEALLVQWEKDDFTTHEPIVNYPTKGSVLKYAEKEFRQLKQEQDRLLKLRQIPFKKRREEGK